MCLQALSKLKIGGWGFKRSEDAGAAGTPPAAGTPSAAAAAAAAQAPAAAESRSSSTTTTGTAEQHEHMQASTELAHSQPAAPGAGIAADAGSVAAVTAESLHPAAPLGAFMLCLDHLVQHAYILLRDQLKRRLTPLLADCISPDNDSMLSPAAGSGAPGAADSATAAAAVAAAPAGSDQDGEVGGQPQSPAAAASTAVAGSAAESAAHAEAALLNFRRCVIVLHGPCS